MNTEPSLKFFDTKTESAPTYPGSALSESPSGVSGKSVELAKMILVIFGIFFVIIVFVGILSEEKGVLTKNESVPVDRSTISEPIGVQPAPSNSSNNSSIPPSRPKQPDVMPRVNSNQNPEAENMRALVLRKSELVRKFALACRQEKGIIQSGFGGQSLCESGTAKIGWPTLSVCGPNPEDTAWTVFRGDTDTWDITISCAFRTECNGPANALCTKDGCTFSDTCLPREL